MYFFDSEFLGQYLDQGIAVKVFVDGEYYDVADRSDVDNDSFGIGYTLVGKPHTFDYRSIEQIKVGSQLVTRDQLGDKITGKEPESPDGEAPDAGGDEFGDDPGGGAPPTAPSGAPSPEDEEEPPQEGYSPRDFVERMLTEAKKTPDTSETGFVKGDLVENTDKQCEYLGSRGAVTNVDLPDNDGGLVMVEYRIFNYGYLFKPGQKVTKPSHQLCKIDPNG